MDALLLQRTCLSILLVLLCILPSSGEFVSPEGSGFFDVVFCEDVSSAGEPLYVSDSFPLSVPQVLLYIPYSGMQDGESWGMYWTVNGEEYADERDQIWDMGPEGWTSYDVTNDGILIEGTWNVDLYRGDEIVRSVSFTVGDEETLLPEEASQYNIADNAGFGRIRFAESVTSEQVPIGEGTTFSYGITEISAVFPYFGMVDSIPWTREWLLDGEEFVRTDDTWEEGEEGITSRNMGYEEDLPLDPGTYTLNLYIDGQLARSADFTVSKPETPEPVETVAMTPDDLIDEELLPAWQMLADSPTGTVREIAQQALDNGVQIRLTDEGNAIAWYRYFKGTTEPGTVYVKRSKYDQYSWVEVAGTIAHELTHAMQHADSGADMHCSVENEYWAYIVELYVYLDNGRKDLIYENWSGLFDDNWGFDADKLWVAVKDAYNTCPEY